MNISRIHDRKFDTSVFMASHKASQSPFINAVSKLFVSLMRVSPVFTTSRIAQNADSVTSFIVSQVAAKRKLIVSRNHLFFHIDSQNCVSQSVNIHFITSQISSNDFPNFSDKYVANHSRNVFQIWNA
jgi:hypothetical protein